MKNTRLEQLLSFLAAQPDDPFLNYALAMEYKSTGQVEKARECYERLQAGRPAYLPTYYQLGKLYEEMGRLADARRTYRQGMELARAQGDQHTLSELRAAWELLEEEDL